MKANELMVGDWVYDENYVPFKVKAYYMHSNTAEPLHPILLTEDILKANGFNEHIMGNVFFKETDEYEIKIVFRNICVKSNSKYVSYSIFKKNADMSSTIKRYVKLLYVHELMHAFRLCKLNELADNFKIN